MSGRFALIIGNSEYTDPGLAQLTAPGKDAKDFARALSDIEICAFDEVSTVLNEPSSSVIEIIDEFFDQKKPDDLLVLYFSGHGVRDEFGSLYLAFKNTVRSRLRSTAIKSDYIREVMDQSRSKRQVLILDCCNSGAFPQGVKAEVGGPMGMVSALQGFGRFVLTASDATQFAWEGNQIIGETDNSLFTHFLVKGLKGEADSDGDGKITVDELYDYAYDQISRVTPKQTPTKSSSKQEGEIVLRQNMRIEDIKPVPLPAELIDEAEDTRPYVREVAVQKLEKILKGKNIAMARSAREVLEKIAADENSTRRVAQAAIQALEFVRQAEQLALQKAEEDRLAAEKEQKTKEYAVQKAEEERKAREEVEHIAILKAGQERIATERAEAVRKAREAEQVSLARTRTEAIQIAREREQRERQLQLQQKPNPTAKLEKKVREQKTNKQPIIKTVFVIGGIGFVFLICSIFGLILWQTISQREQNILNTITAGTPLFPSLTATIGAETSTSLPTLPTNTPLIFPNITPTITLPPTITPICDQAQLIKDVTIPDGTILLPGVSFTKTWRLKNIGACAWSGYYSLVFDSGNPMNGPSSISISTTLPGQEVDISVTLKAPPDSGSYRGYWRIRSSSGVLLPVVNGYQGKSFFVDIRVVGPTPTVTSFSGVIPTRTPTRTRTPNPTPTPSVTAFPTP